MPKYLVIETFPSLEQAAIVCDPDTGKNKVFNDYDAAEAEALECQAGRLVKIGSDPDSRQTGCQACKKLGTTICGNDTTGLSCFE